MKTVVFLCALLLSPAIAFANLSATVKWNPSPEPDVDTYVVYRLLSACSTFAQGQGTIIARVPAPTTTYVDSSIPDATTVVAYRIAAENKTTISPQSACVEKSFASTLPPTIPVYDDAALWVAIDLLKARLQAVEGDVAVLKEQRDRMKAGLCKLTGSSLTKDVLAERAALGGCP